MQIMRYPSLTRLVDTLSNSAPKEASEKVRLAIKKQMTVSKRQGSWFRLNVQERSILNFALTLKLSFKSVDLMRAIMSVLRRLQSISSCPPRLFFRAAEVARAFSEAAVSWGNAGASEWKSDTVYITFLAKFWVSPRPFALAR